MKRDVTNQFSLAEAFVGRKLGANETLDRIGKLARWYRFEKLLNRLHVAETGRPSYPPLVMFKALLLAQWYGLSDMALEEALNDRLSFRRFVGLGLDGATPDHTTLCRFRNDLAAAGLTEKLFEEMNRQLERLGLVLKRGTLIDATLVEAATTPPAFGSEEEGLDPEAAFGKRTGRGGSIYGFKAHVAVDQGSILIRDAVLTPGNVNETVVADELAVDWLLSVSGQDAHSGARPLRRTIQRHVEDAVSELLIGAREQPECPEVTVVDNELKVLVRSSAAVGPGR